ncbi:hypothetical protein PJI17_14260 [Mycobacterium kansasii]|uniref:Uncharacterized protein n=1 Tax=Mycobacterium kansasii TaxID=1768 RepID=A0A1V3XYG7_MYCKA|nr:hypothetical protein BZL30_0933 [Mycobacterium kansasii]OOK83816.1 hypothetical protein BZL29_0968 [Mycobacterium kansasii]
MPHRPRAVAVGSTPSAQQTRNRIEIADFVRFCVCSASLLGS